MITYEIIILICWAAFIFVWIVSAFNTKRDIRGGHGGAWRRFWLLRLVVAAVFIFVLNRQLQSLPSRRTNFGYIFSRGIFPQSSALGWIAAALSVVGVSFAIWARVHLGRNWSSYPTMKEHHELVTSGPYAYVRHPIYTGLLFMAFSIALTGSIFGIGVLLVASLVFVLRIGKEEEIMLELFPNEYPEYRKRTKALIPFVI